MAAGAQEVSMTRVVTGYDQDGHPAVLFAGDAPTVIHAGRYTTTELWVSDRGPLGVTDTDAAARDWALEPPAGGACFRIVAIAPDAASAADGDGAGHAAFQAAHATDTLDYVTILHGEVTLVVGSTEVVLLPGDSVVQQPGVLHDWQNRSGETAVMVGVLLSAR
jgi:mannose-6-phosphate isomerase-like protein (cupin superfamily)